MSNQNISFPTHLIYRALGQPPIETEPCVGICAFCGIELTEGIKLKDSVSDVFTNFDCLIDINASHVCIACHVCLKEAKLRRYNFIATPESIKYFKRDELELLLFNPPEPPFVMAVTINSKKHMSFKARVNYSSKLYYIQKEDEQILFSPEKYKGIFAVMKRLYNFHSKIAIETRNYQQNLIRKQGLKEFVECESYITGYRGSQQFNLLLYAMNMSDENMAKMKERIAKKEAKISD
jgi:CRISPR type IV-associated protein Csf1